MRVTTKRKLDKATLDVDNDEPLYREKEFNAPADELIEAVKQYLHRTEGQTYSPERTKELVNKIINRRLA